MKLIFEHIIVNGYVIDVYGSVDYDEKAEEYLCDIDYFVVTFDGYRVKWQDFFQDVNNRELFFKTLEDTEEQYQEYLRQIYHGH